jgi:hypothetical protein
MTTAKEPWQDDNGLQDEPTVADYPNPFSDTSNGLESFGLWSKGCDHARRCGCGRRAGLSRQDDIEDGASQFQPHYVSTPHGGGWS